ncbi:competence protein ComFA [Evansella vedderi]|uniref:Competence protein ComFA n=1 Tax=Evansella vedderi TaxID=38282 RepID=A0ABT9ZTF5_9BACI|nr:DEAD/DEAH box helicase [Evansella vedderi]MDQ0254523.1 competence protein ComFA [Evansella vedderi]
MRFYPIKMKAIIHSANSGNNQFFPHITEKAKEEDSWLLPEFPPYEMEKKLLNDPPPLNHDDSLLAPFLQTTPKPIIRLHDTNWYFPPPNEQFTPNPNMETYLKNRRLLIDELPFSHGEIHQHVAHGWAAYEPGITPRGRGHHCNRCGNTDPSLFANFQCFRCKDDCVYCRSCLMMGKVTGCSPLVTWKGVSGKIFSETKKHVMAWDGTLSLFQQKASDKLCTCISNFLQGKNERDHFLIWACCGSGKTEMLFHGIKLALNSGVKVLIATPRTDVVLELEPRFKQAFPDTVIHAFYGGAKERFAQGELVISTTHQLLRFHRAFDLVIIDEVDAFPYTADKKLRYAVSQARRERALTVFVTATPDDTMKREAEKGLMECAKVARRYHRHPLPEPALHWIGQWKKGLGRRRLPSKVVAFVKKHLQGNKQIFLFVPSVRVMEEVEASLKKVVDVTVGAVHSADEERREKVMAFRKGEIRVLVTTTILERGVTVKGVQVGVLGAEDRIFTESALVQIAGRAGRSPDEPTGEVIYFHHGKTNEMVKALKHIKRMNALGEEELLKEKRGGGK